MVSAQFVWVNIVPSLAINYFKLTRSLSLSLSLSLDDAFYGTLLESGYIYI